MLHLYKTLFKFLIKIVVVIGKSKKNKQIELIF